MRSRFARESELSSNPKQSLLSWWPVVLPLLAVAGSTVRAEAQLSSHDRQIETLRKEGVPSTNERLARIEEKLDAQDHSLKRIEGKLDAGR
jgi:alkylated DNA nucleotide flippase Atl1